MTTVIRPIASPDRERWLPLWQGYLRFYRHRLPDELTALCFSRLADPQCQPHGLVAERAGALIGFAHYLFHPSTWAAKVRTLKPTCGARSTGCKVWLTDWKPRACSPAKTMPATRL